MYSVNLSLSLSVGFVLLGVSDSVIHWSDTDYQDSLTHTGIDTKEIGLFERGDMHTDLIS